MAQIQYHININDLVHQNSTALIAESEANFQQAEARFVELCRRNIIEMCDNASLTEADVERMKREELYLETQMLHAASVRARITARHSNILAQLQHLPSSVNPHRNPAASKTEIKIKEITAAEAGESCGDVCSICSNDHTRIESCVTDCGHWFGGECYRQWMRCSSNNMTTCPICRTKNKEVFTHKVSAAKRTFVLDKPEYIEKLEKGK